jgi:ABC-2 type transport system permease protein/sodium transport system permease protein
MSETSPNQFLGRISRLVRKEVSTILRDRRTIITLVLMPLLLYPLMSIAFHQFLLAGAHGKHAEHELSVVVPSEEDAKVVTRHLKRGWEVIQQQPRPEGARESDISVPLVLYPVPNPREEVLAGRYDLALRLRGPVREPRGNEGLERMLDYEAYYLESSARGRETLERVQVLLEAAHRDLLSKRRQWVNRPPPVLVVRILPGPLADPEPKPVISLMALIPLVLILMTITGAVYPAIDLTAGERERGTLEILVAAPVPRLELLFAKYVSVVLVAVLTAVVNLATMTLTLQVSGLGSKIFDAQSLTFLAIVQVFLLLLLFAAFFSAVLLAVTSFARSFKEAQAYLIPLMLLSLTPGVASLMPDLKLDNGRALVPLLNIVLLGRDVLTGKAELATGAIVVLSTLIYAVGAVALAARVFGAEAVLYSEQAGWSDLFRRPSQPRPAPSVAGALLCLALLFPATFVAINLLARLGGSIEEELAWKGLANVLLFGGLPLLFVWLGRIQALSAYRLDRLGLAFWGAALLLGVSLWPIADLIQRALRQLGLGLDTALLAGASERFQRWREVSPVLIVVGFAIVPAVLEELFFRGFLFGALLRASGPRAAIIGSALFFGVFHLVDQGLIVVERGLTSTLLGLILAWLCWRSGSVIPGMILHAVHNSCLVLLAYYQPKWLTENVPPAGLAVAISIVVLVVAGIEYLCRKRVDTPEAIG